MKVSNNSNQIVSFEIACKIMKEELPHIDTVRAWFDYSKSGKRDERLPSDPYTHYSRTGEWPKNGWAVFLNTQRKSNIEKSKTFYSYKDAKEFSHLMEFESLDEYREFITDNHLTNELPLHPDKYYRKTEGSFSKKDFLPPKFYKKFEDAAKAIAEAGISFETVIEWQKVSKEKRPAKVHSNPFTYYNVSLEQLVSKVNEYKALN